MFPARCQKSPCMKMCPRMPDGDQYVRMNGWCSYAWAGPMARYAMTVRATRNEFAYGNDRIRTSVASGSIMACASPTNRHGLPFTASTSNTPGGGGYSGMAV